MLGGQSPLPEMKCKGVSPLALDSRGSPALAESPPALTRPPDPWKSPSSPLPCSPPHPRQYLLCRDTGLSHGPTTTVRPQCLPGCLLHPLFFPLTSPRGMLTVLTPLSVEKSLPLSTSLGVPAGPFLAAWPGYVVSFWGCLLLWQGAWSSLSAGPDSCSVHVCGSSVCVCVFCWCY